MVHPYDISGMSIKIQSLKQTAIELRTMSRGIPAVERNVERILASVRVLELDISDVLDVP